MELNGRQIDTACPYEIDCWADQYCANLCPPTLLDVLKQTAELEHECELLPHTDPDIEAVCHICHNVSPPIKTDLSMVEWNRR